MSYKLSRRVFSLDISSTEKLVLRALADHANDDGSSCYPSILTLATETSLSRRTIQATLGSLKEKGLVMIVGQSKGGRGKTPDYQLRLPEVDQKSNQKTPVKGVAIAPFTGNKGRKIYTERVQNLHVKGAAAAPDSVLDSIHDSTPSPLPSPEGKPPSREGSNQEELVYEVYRERVYIRKPKHRRLWTSREKESMHGQRAADYVQFFINKGFQAYILPPREVKP